MKLPPGAYFDPQGYNYIPAPPGLPPTHYFRPDGPVASLGDQTGTDRDDGTSYHREPEADDSIQLDQLAQALLASTEVCETNPLL